MKSFSSSLLAILLGFSAQAADGFTVRGEIPGLPAGTRVQLVSRERGARGELAETTAGPDGSFTLKGSVSSPSLCEIRIDKINENELDKAISLMVENTDMTVRAAHIDSVAPGFYTGTRGRYMERNVAVTGGQAQKEYAEYTEALFPYEIASRQAHYDLYWAEGSKNRSEEQEAPFEKAYKEAGRAEREARRAFIAANPTYSISGLLMLDDISSPFTYTATELDAIGNSVKAMADTARLSQINKAIDFGRKYPREALYTDFAALDTLGAERKFSDFVGDGKYVMVDFWASW